MKSLKESRVPRKLAQRAAERQKEAEHAQEVEKRAKEREIAAEKRAEKRQIELEERANAMIHDMLTSIHEDLVKNIKEDLRSSHGVERLKVTKDIIKELLPYVKPKLSQENITNETTHHISDDTQKRLMELAAFCRSKQ